MKKSITTLALALAIIGSAVAQKPSTKGGCGNMSNPTPTKMEQSSNGKEFSLRYQINVAAVNSSFDKNSTQIKELCDFIKGTGCDETKEVTKINICGYSSPDGPAATNQRLATARATDFREYLNTKCNLSKCEGTTKGIVTTWSDTKSAVESSSIPEKSKVLELVNSSQPQMVIESKLKAMPSAWDYLVKSILPPMRCVQVEVFYTQKCPKPTTAVAPKPAPVEEVVIVENNYLYYVAEDDSDMKIYENSAALPLDYEPREHTRFIFKENNRREKIKGDYRDIYGRERSTVKYK